MLKYPAFRKHKEAEKELENRKQYRLEIEAHDAAILREQLEQEERVAREQEERAIREGQDRITVAREDDIDREAMGEESV